MKPATLLAKKCLTKPQSEEVEALLTLVENKSLDVDWFEVLDTGKSLLEMSFKNIKERPLINKLLTVVGQTTPLTPQSPVNASPQSPKLAHMLFSSPHLWRLGNELFKDHPPTKEEWQDFLTHSPFRLLVLSPQFEELKKSFSCVSSSQWKDLEDYRTANLWMSQTSLAAFNVHAPKNMTPSQLLAWTDFSLPLLKTQQDSWRLDIATTRSHLWKQWSEDDWMSVWERQPFAGFLLKKTKDLHVTGALSFVKTFAPTPSSRSLYILSKEMNALAKAQAEIKDHYSAGTTYQTLDGIIKTSAKLLKTWSDAIFPSQGSDFTQGLFLGMIQNAQASTKFNPIAIKAWEKAPSISHIDDFVEKIRQTIPEGNVKASSWWLHPDLLAYFIQQYLLSQENSPNLKDFTKSLNFDTLSHRTVPQNEQDALALKLVQVGSRLCQDPTIPSSVQKAGAEIFWRSVFLINPANQHYWLKKASGISPLSQKLDFWGPAFQQKLEEANSQRKKTKEITALLTKLSLNNILDLEKAPSAPKSRKM